MYRPVTCCAMISHECTQAPCDYGAWSAVTSCGTKEIADTEGKLHKHASAELRKTSSMTGASLGTSMFGPLGGGEPTGEPGAGRRAVLSS